MIYICPCWHHSVTQSRPALCNPMDCSTSGFPGLHQVLEFTQTHVHRVSDAIQPSHPLSSPSPPAFNISQHQGLSQWVGSSHQVAKVLEFSFSISPSSEYSGLISFRIDWFNFLANPRDSQESSPAPQFKSINSLALSFFMVQLSHDCWKNHSFDYTDLCQQSDVSAFFNTPSRFVIAFVRLHILWKDYNFSERQSHLRDKK